MLVVRITIAQKGENLFLPSRKHNTKYYTLLLYGGLSSFASN